MKSLSTFIYEELDDNIFWKIETWFKRKPAEYKEFIKLVDDCRNSYSVDINFIEDAVKKMNLDVKKFIDFLDDDVYNEIDDKDYIYQLKKVIEIILGNKSKTLEAK